MKVKAKSKYLRISPKKMRLVTSVIQGMDVEKALIQLDFIPKRGCDYVKKTLSSAISNAEHNFEIDKSNLFIKEIFVNEGPTLKRWRPRAFGRAGQIRKRSSHLEIILEEKEPGKKKGVKKTTKEKKEKIKEPEIKPLSEAEEVISQDKKEEIKKDQSVKPEPRHKTKSPSKPKGKKAFKNIFRRKSI